MQPPLGLALCKPNMVCKIKKSLCGLKQDSRQWYSKLSDTLRGLRFQHSKNNHSLFHKLQGTSIVLVAVCVDDVVIIGNSPAEIATLKVFLDDKFKTKDLSELNYFLGMEICKVSSGLILTQRKFAMDLLKEFQCDTLLATTCPLGPLSKTHSTDDSLADATTYRKLVGKLNYPTNTRSDIAFAVQCLSQFLQAPTKSHMTATLHALR